MKRMVLVTLMLAILLSLAACGETTNTPGTTDTPGGSEVVTQNPEQTGTGSGKTDAPSGGKLPGSGKTEESVETGPVPLQVLLGSHYEGEWSENFTPLCDWTWSSIVLSEAAAEDFPELDANLREMNAGNYEYNMQRMYEMLPLAKEAAAEQEYFGGFTSSSEYLVQRADDRVLSIREDGSEYTDGVHPNYWVIGMNLDPATGEQMELSDVLTDPEKLPAILTEKIRSKYTFEPFSGLQEQLEGYEEGHYSWTLDYQGITFYFSPYEIAPYAAGLLTATIWFDEMPELFVEKYTETPESGWAKLLPNANEVEVDLQGGDNERDSLYVSTLDNEYGSLQLYVTKNGQEQHLDECYGFTMKPLLVCLGEPGNERYFLYIEASAENDYTTIYVYDLNEDEITLNGEFSGAGFASVWDENVGEYGTWYEEVFNDPSEFVLSTTIQLLGTWVGQRTYRTNPQTGALQPQTEYYMLPEDVVPIVSAIDLEVTMLPDGKKETLPAGTSFYFRRYYPQTDELEYAELELEDGRECRIEVVYEDWEPRINGVLEWDCFVDLMYYAH